MNPYSVLGVDPSATDEELKVAYRKLVKKYHPDIAEDKVMAEEKMKQINSAYDTIKNLREHPGQSDYTNNNYSNSYNYSGSTNQNYYGFNGYTYNLSPYQQIQILIQLRRLQEAKTILSTIDDKNGMWYYYSAIINYSLGDKELALSHIQTAIQQEPNNDRYQELYNSMKSNSYYGSGSYRANGYRPFSFFGLIFKYFFYLLVIRFIIFLVMSIF